MTFLLPLAAILMGLPMLIWSTDRLIEGATAVARHGQWPPLGVGLVILGLGSSAPALLVSAWAASLGHPSLALGGAWGSNIVNLGLILGVTALIAPVHVQSQVLRRELPLLLGAITLSAALAWDLTLSREEAWGLLALFALLTVWSLSEARTHGDDALAIDTARELQAHTLPRRRALLWMWTGGIMLTLASGLLAWGAVAVAQDLGISDLAMGLTVVALGTSLPELATCVAAARKGEGHLALGQVLGAGLSNTLAVVGIAGAIEPTDLDPTVLTREWPVMVGLTLMVGWMGSGRRGPGRIRRPEAAALLAFYGLYTLWLLWTLGPR